MLFHRSSCTGIVYRSHMCRCTYRRGALEQRQEPHAVSCTRGICACVLACVPGTLSSVTVEPLFDGFQRVSVRVNQGELSVVEFVLRLDESSYCPVVHVLCEKNKYNGEGKKQLRYPGEVSHHSVQAPSSRKACSHSRCVSGSQCAIASFQVGHLPCSP